MPLRPSLSLASLLLASVAVAQLPESAKDLHEYDLVDVKWDLSFSFQQAVISGEVVNSVVPIKDGASLIFDCRHLNVSKVQVNGVAAMFENSGKVLSVHPATPALKGQRLAVRIWYTGAPEAGIYFVPANRSFPAHSDIVYSQGEMVDNRYWLPTYDSPDDKATFECNIHVPLGWKALSNGRLIERVRKGNEQIWHWKLDQPASTYLISLVAGPYDEIVDGTDPVPVSYWVPSGLDDWGKAAFGKTAEIVKFYGSLTGYKYPWPKYAQSAVPDFMFGGMENVTCTTQTINALFPPALADTKDATGLVAHELAHQWFGDLVTTKDWSHTWLNEGWATFLPHFWMREKFGAEAYDLGRLDDFDAAVQAHRGRPDRSVVWNGYKEPIDMFDGFAYPGGAARMFMLMHLATEAKFWPAITKYLTQNQYKNVTTETFFDSVSNSLGMNLDSFRKQWFYTAAAPSLALKRDARGVYIEQSNIPFNLPLEYWLVSGGSIERKKLELLGDKRTDLPDADGKLVLLDPEVWLIADISYNLGYSGADWAQMYRVAPNAAQKARIVQEGFGAMVEADRIAIARQERSWRLLQRILPSIKDVGFLVEMSKSSDPHIVAEAVDAMAGSGNSTEVKDRLHQLLTSSSANEDTKEASFAALLNITADPSLADRGLKMDSYNDGYRTGSLNWLSRNRPDTAREVATSALADPNTSEPMRLESIRTLGQVKDRVGERKVYKILTGFMSERSNSPLRAAIGALAEYGDKSAIPVLNTRANHGLHFVRRDIADAIERLRRLPN